MPVYRVNVDGKEYQVEVGDLNTRPVQVKVDGRVVQVSVESASAAAQPAASGIQAPVPSTPLSAVSAAPVVAASAQTSLDLDVLAPMPGFIVSVEVSPGTKVVVGQDLCVLDAMKMNNRIRALREGVIAQIHVQPGDQVQHGDKLVTFES